MEKLKMKKGLSVISICLVLILLFSTSLYATAASTESKSISDYTIYDLKDMTVKEKLDLLKQFEKNMVLTI